MPILVQRTETLGVQRNNKGWMVMVFIVFLVLVSER